MKTAKPPLSDGEPPFLRMPGWIARCPKETLEEAGFLSGAALSHLDLAARSEWVPQNLWRARLARLAAEGCVGFTDLRDALHLMRPGDRPGPAGEVFQAWSMAVARPISVAGLHKALPGVTAAEIALCLDARGGNPVDQAAAVLEAVLVDAALAKSLGWSHLLPVLALALRTRDLWMRADDLRLACHRGVVTAAGLTFPLAADLLRGAARLQAVASKLRAKGADRAVALILSRDALAPTALLSFMSDRAARRLCDRLVELRAVRELTGRDTFRLYGV